MKICSFALMLIIGISLAAQSSNPGTILVPSPPSGSCKSGLPNEQVSTTGVEFSCQHGRWIVLPRAAGDPSHISSGTIGKEQLPTFADWRVVGPVTASSVDQTENVTKAWNAVGATYTTGLMTPGSLRLDSSVAPKSGLQAYALTGLGGSGQSGSGTTFIWYGGAAPAFALDRNRDALVGPFNLHLRNISGALGIILSQLRNTTGGISSHNFLHDINIDGLTGPRAYGVSVGAPSGDSGQNNEAHTFWRLSVGSPFYDLGSTCFVTWPPGYNMRGIGYYESETSGCGTAYYMGAKSSHIIGGITEAHNLVLGAHGADQGMTAMMFGHDESSKQGLSGTSNSMLIGNVYEMDRPDTTKPWWDFSNIGSYDRAITIGNAFNDFRGTPKETAFKYPTYAKWISIGDYFGANKIPTWPSNGPGTALMLGTQNIYGNADIVSIHGGTAEGIDSTSGGAFFAASGSLFHGVYPSPPLTLAAGTTASTCPKVSTVHGPLNWCFVPFTFQVLMANTGPNSAATLKLEPPKDPQTGTTWPNALNFDFQTNAHGGSFKVSDLQAATAQLASGHTFTRHTIVNCSLSPSRVAANTCEAQTGLSCRGVAAGDIVLNAASAKPTDQAGLVLNNVRVMAANTISMNFCNMTASPITPTASEEYTLDVEQ